MSFERTKGSIASLEGSRISADQLLDMLVCVTRDVFEENQVSNAAGLPVGDQTVLLKKLYNLMRVLLQIYEDNADGIQQFSQRIQSEFGQAGKEMQQHTQQLSFLLAEIARLKQQNDLLEAALEKTREQRGHLLQAQEQCAAMEKELELLNDPALDAMGAQKDAMEAELTQRKATAQALQAQLDQVQAELEAVEAQLKNAQSELSDAQNRMTESQQAMEAAVQEKAQLEAQTAQLQEQIRQAKERLGQLPEQKQQLDARLQELEMKLTVILNAVQSAKNDAFLEENLFILPGAGKTFTVEDCPDLALAGQTLTDWEQTQAWFDQMEQRIQGLMDVVQKLLTVAVSTAESITDPKGQE